MPYNTDAELRPAFQSDPSEILSTVVDGDFWHERAPGIRKPDPVEVEVKAGQEVRVEASY